MGSGLLGEFNFWAVTALLGPETASPDPEQQRGASPAEVHVVDGDTLLLGTQVVRLEGIQAPPRGETCADPSGRSFDCGAAAAARLASLLADHEVDCQLHGRDAFSRPLGRCRSAGMQVNSRLVADGWAIADGDTFSASENQARSHGLGLWASGVVPPADWQDRR